MFDNDSYITLFGSVLTYVQSANTYDDHLSAKYEKEVFTLEKNYTYWHLQNVSVYPLQRYNLIH